MEWYWIVLIVIGVLVIGFLIFALTYGRKMQAKQAEAQKQMDLNKMTATILVIDKKKKKLTEAGLPDAVVQQAPKMSRRMKVPVVRCKVGNQVMNLIADNDVFEILPLKKTCTVTVSGIYITELKAVRGGSVPKINKKQGFMSRMRSKAQAFVKKNS